MTRSIHSLTARLLNGCAALALMAAGLNISAQPVAAQTLPTILPGTTFTVTTNDDTNDGVCDRHCSLREAILRVNADTGYLHLPDRIEFSIPLRQTLTVQLLSALPQLTNVVTIDGDNQPTFTVTITFIDGQWRSITTFIEHPGNVEIRDGGTVNTGLSVVATSTTLRNLAVTGFGGTGVELRSTASTTTLESLSASGNGTGVAMLGSNSTLRNSLVSQNVTGVRVSGNQNTVSGNTITGNTGTGVRIEGTNVTLGGTTSAARNIISANTGEGVVLASASGARVIGNYIGLDVSGTTAQPNGLNGIDIAQAGSSTIGGPTAVERNVISGNAGNGIFVALALTGGTHVIQGNFVGTNAAGTAAVANGLNGVSVSQSASSGLDEFSTRAQIVGNVISGNHQNGVILSGGAHSVVQSNFIGTDLSATRSLPNGAPGPFPGITILDARQVTVGGAVGDDNPSLGNVIAHNGNSGVTVFTPTADSQTAVGNTIRFNRIFDNGRLGIDLAQTNVELGFGVVTPNDFKDADNGANHRQNFPVLQAAFVPVAGSLTVIGTLNSTPLRPFVVDFYASASCDFGGSGEGERFIGSSQAVTDTEGNAVVVLNAAPTSAVTSGVVTATATSIATNDTSEFSHCQAVGG